MTTAPSANSSNDLLDATSRALAAAYARNERHRFVAGPDGFVDEICHVVAQRRGVDAWDRMTSLAEFGRRIAEAAGHSANIEYVVQRIKIGGNGPIMAAALGTLGLDMTYLGAVGQAQLHPVFEPLRAFGDVLPLCEPGHTDAVEFHDGKIMQGKMTSLAHLTWDLLARNPGAEALTRMLGDARLLGLVNWTMIPHMTEILAGFAEHVLPRLDAAGRARRFAFFDLCDPGKRDARDLVAALATFTRFESHFSVILGLNRNEVRLVSAALGGPGSDGTGSGDPAPMAAHIRRHLGLSEVVVHSAKFALVATAEGTAQIAAPYTAQPAIATGAGDHFNAGYTFGRVVGLAPAEAMCTGLGVGSFYVREARSPTRDDLAAFLGRWRAGEVSAA